MKFSRYIRAVRIVFLKRLCRDRRSEASEIHALPPTIVATLLGLSGLEPPTSRLSGVRSNHLSYKPIWIWPFLPAHHLIVDNLHCLHGEYEIRTRDLLLARQALSQLS